jgi:hypothetical protein
MDLDEPLLRDETRDEPPDAVKGTPKGTGDNR